MDRAESIKGKKVFEQDLSVLTGRAFYTIQSSPATGSWLMRGAPKKHLDNLLGTSV